MGIVILSLPTLQEHSRIRGDDKCMRSMLKNITHYANMRDCQTSHLSFLLSGLAFLETRQHMQNPAHTWHTVGGQSLGAVPGLCLWSCLWSGRSKILSHPSPHFFFPSTPLFNQHLVIPQSWSRSEVLWLLSLHSFLHLIVAVHLFLWSCLSCLPLNCNPCDNRDLIVSPAQDKAWHVVQ